MASGFKWSRNFSYASWFWTRVGNVLEMMRPAVAAAAGATPNCGGDWAWSAAAATVTVAAAGNTHLVRTSKNRTVAHASKPAVFS